MKEGNELFTDIIICSRHFDEEDKVKVIGKFLCFFIKRWHLRIGAFPKHFLRYYIKFFFLQGVVYNCIHRRLNCTKGVEPGFFAIFSVFRPFR